MRRPYSARSALAALLLAAFAASATLAQAALRPPGEAGLPSLAVHTPLPLPTIMPPPGATASPSVAGANALSLPALRPRVIGGQTVPLSSLPPLPGKTAANTAYFGSSNGFGRRRMAANGAQINFFADNTNSACSSAVGSIIPTGCDVKWNSANLPGGQTWQDYFINVNTSTATVVGGTYTTNPGPAEQTANLNTTGTYVLATYDVTSGGWEAVVYVSVGNVNVFGTYADSAAHTSQTQFIAANGTNVYVNASGLVQGDNYVVYIESTSGNSNTNKNVYCAYIAPPGGSTPNPNGFCDPTTSPGIAAVAGSQSSAAITATWPLSSSTPPGTYSVVLYNLTTNTRLAMRQVSIMKSAASGTITIVPQAGNPAPGGLQFAPTPPPLRTAATVFAFDNSLDQSDKTFTMNGSGLPINTNYTITLSDPTGSLVQTHAQGTGAGGSFSWAPATFNKNGESPSDYVSNSYTVTLQNQATGAVDYSYAYQILGYNVATQYTNPAGTALALASGTTATTGLAFTNDGDAAFGIGNGDTIRGIAFDTGGNGVGVTLNGVATSGCGGNCTTQSSTATDSNGQIWNVTNTCNNSTGNGGCTIVATPATIGQTLAMNASLTLSNLTFSNTVGSHCGSGCNATTVVLPTDGDSWSASNQSYATNLVYFTNGASGVPTGTASVSHYGYVDSGNGLHIGQETHGYNYNNSNMTYTASSPFTTPAGYADDWSIAVSNTSPVGTNPITQIQIQLPTGYSPGGTSTIPSVDQANSPGWAIAPCPAGSPPTAFCLRNANGNAGIAVGTSQTIYIELSPPPPAAYAYTDWVLQAIKPSVFSLSPAASFTAFVPAIASYDSTATAAYSLNGTLITPGFSPTSEGQNTNHSVTIDVTNTSTAQDPFPDYLDEITIDLPSANAFSSVSGLPVGWSLLGTSTPVAGTTRYWFGLCAGQFNTADGPVSNPPPVNPTIPSCGGASEASAIAPGATFTATGNLQTGTSNITATMNAHGANGAAWSSSHTFTMNVTAVSAAAGFSAAGGYPTGTTVTSPNTPQIGADANTTYGNSFTYVIKNTSGTGQNITSATITVPGKDASGVLPSDGTAWTLTGSPSISGTTYGCTVTSSISAQTNGTNGAINIGGGSCSIPPGSALTINFTAKAPYTVNDTYQFPTTVNGAVTASEQWSTDTIVQIILAASLSIAVNPGNPGPGGSTPSVSCVPCVFNTGTNTVDFGPIANTQTVSGGDVVRVSVYTNAGSSVGWKLYVSTSTNPANTGSPTNELLSSIDSTRSAPTSGINFDQSAYAVIPTTSPGMLLMDTGTGRAAQRTPFDELMNFQISIQGGPVTPTTATVTYTFISN